MADPVIFVVDNNLSAETCMAIISNFKEDDGKWAGTTLGGLTAWKKTLDLQITNKAGWENLMRCCSQH